MDERFTYLVQKHLDYKLEGAEIIEFDKYLENPECLNYLEDARVANSFVEREMRKMFANPEKAKELMADLGFDEKTKEDILRYGKKSREG
jgi:SOS response regulatory protein OraA/RecX